MRKTLIIVLNIIFFANILYSQGIDIVQKWAWIPSAGWLSHYTSDSVYVYSSHLEGYAYSENIGWISFGNYNGGDEHTYQNVSALDYGVNNDGLGNLSGYAWSPVAGWINFAPTEENVTIDTLNGEFKGYAYSDNLGWISFSGMADDDFPYGVATSWRPEVSVNIEDDIFVNRSTGDLDFMAFPNPQSAGSYYIEFSFVGESNLEFFLEIYNLYGKKIMETSPEVCLGYSKRRVLVAKIKTTDFSKGVYIAVLRTKNTSTGEFNSASLKFIIN